MKSEYKNTHKLSDMRHVPIGVFDQSVLEPRYHLNEKAEYSLFSLLSVNLY